MKKISTLVVLILLFSAQGHAQNFNNQFINAYKWLPIPDTLGGVFNSATNEFEYDLRIHEGLVQFSSLGQQTVTSGYNQYNFLGPTIVYHKGQNIRMNVANMSNEVSTIHWHGIHLPAVMDGGPYQPIYPGTIWKPYWVVSDSASTFWYHSHLDLLTNGQVTAGLAGMIIVHDDYESSLPIPQTYGVDDIPLILTNRRFNAANQFEVVDTAPPPGDYLLTNGVTRAITTLPRNIVRFRLLNGSVARAFNIGLKDSSAFMIMGTDGGLLDSLVSVRRYILGPGERISILVDLSRYSLTDTPKLMAFNRQLPGSYPGGPYSYVYDTIKDTVHHTYTVDSSRYDSLSDLNFPLLTIALSPTDPSLVTTMPVFYKDNHFQPTPFAPDITRNVTLDVMYPNIFDSAFAPFNIDRTYFSMGVNNKVIPLGNKEVWRVHNKTGEPHPFHIHDIQFYIRGIYYARDLSTNLVKPEQQGWKDLILIDTNCIVEYYTEFTDYADPLWPYMYHCHILDHEDAGMMAQFLVVDSGHTSVPMHKVLPETAVNVYPNPATDKLHVDMTDKASSVYYITVYDMAGRSLQMLPKPKMENGLDVKDLKPGEYLLKIYDTQGYITYKKFIKV